MNSIPCKIIPCFRVSPSVNLFSSRRKCSAYWNSTYYRKKMNSSFSVGHLTLQCFNVLMILFDSSLHYSYFLKRLTKNKIVPNRSLQSPLQFKSTNCNRHVNKQVDIYAKILDIYFLIQAFIGKNNQIFFDSDFL